jgi:hypothetical protein
MRSVNTRCFRPAAVPDVGAVASAADGWGDDDVANDGDWDDWGDEGHETGTGGQGNGKRRERASQERVGHFQRQIKVGHLMKMEVVQMRILGSDNRSAGVTCTDRVCMGAAIQTP